MFVTTPQSAMRAEREQENDIGGFAISLCGPMATLIGRFGVHLDKNGVKCLETECVS
jgi:hypothetical protein